MIYLLHGNDFKKSREKLHQLVDALLKKEPDSSQFRIDLDNFSPEFLQEMVSGQTLFTGRYIVVADKLFQDKPARPEGPRQDGSVGLGSGGEAAEIILKELKNIANSENIFIFIEEELTKAVLGRFEKWAEKIQEFSGKVAPKEDKFNVFSITDALSRKDKKNTWVLYQKALNSGMVPEEIHGILFWQVKNLLMVKDEADPKGLGLNPFVLRKSLSAAEKFKKSELIKLSQELVEIPHNARRGLEDFGVSLERFILSI
jgi:DNA polymerase III delta subunit